MRPTPKPSSGCIGPPVSAPSAHVSVEAGAQPAIPTRGP